MIDIYMTANDLALHKDSYIIFILSKANEKDDETISSYTVNEGMGWYVSIFIIIVMINLHNDLVW